MKNEYISSTRNRGWGWRTGVTSKLLLFGPYSHIASESNIPVIYPILKPDQILSSSKQWRSSCIFLTTVAKKMKVTLTLTQGYKKGDGFLFLTSADTPHWHENSCEIFRSDSRPWRRRPLRPPPGCCSCTGRGPRLRSSDLGPQRTSGCHDPLCGPKNTWFKGQYFVRIMNLNERKMA